MKKFGFAMTVALVAAMMVASAAFALFFTNGNFESGGWTPGWDSANSREFLIFAGGYDTTGFPTLNSGGTDLSAIVGGPAVAALSLSDPNTGGVLKYPAVGHYSARINSQDAWNKTGGYPANANTIYQTTVVDAADVDGEDNLVHLRMMYAAVMSYPREDLGANAHTHDELPMFFLEVRDETANTILVHRQSYAGEAGVPWQATGIMMNTTSEWYFLDWTLIDVIAGDTSILGHTLSVDIVATACSLGGHPGYIYIDEVGSQHVGVPSIFGTGPATTTTGSTIPYTFKYYNGTSNPVDSHLAITAPTGVDFVATGLPAECSLASNLVTCDFTAIPATSGGNFQVQGTVTAASGATITLGDYTIATPGYPTLGGPAINTNVIAIPAPFGTTLTPNVGPTSGGTAVVITGTNFTDGTVKFDPVTADATCTVVSDTEIDCTTPAHAAGPVDVVVTTPGGAYTFTNGFTYIAPPVINTLTPNHGPVTGGTTVVITGTALTGGTVKFDPATANATCTVDSATQITCTTPAHAAGPVDVVVTTPGGAYTFTNGFTYIALPVILSLTPHSGPVTGGTTVIIAGTGLTGGTVKFDPATADATCTVNSDTQITCTTPAHAAGPVDVVVTTPIGGFTFAKGFTYLPLPTISTLMPNRGPTTGGTTVVITGTDLNDGTVKFDPATADATCTVDSSTQITCTTPAHVAGLVDVVVTTPGGAYTFTNGFTYYPVVAITELFPNAGPITGGTEVVILGMGFYPLPDTTVTFDGLAATCTVDSATQLTCLTPAHPSGPVDVVVTSLGGLTTFTQGFTYYAHWAVFYSDGTLDGWVKQKAVGAKTGYLFSTTLNIPVGDDRINRQIRSILSFNTFNLKLLPKNAKLGAAFVRIRRLSIVGTNPFTTLGNLNVDIKKGYFGASKALGPDDYMAAATANKIGEFNKALSGTGWYTMSFTPKSKAYINRTGLTQLRLRFTLPTDMDRSPDFFRYYPGDTRVARINKAQLVIYYTLP